MVSERRTAGRGTFGPVSRWDTRAFDPGEAERLGSSLSLHPLVAAVLCARGLSRAADARAYLHPSIGRLADPFLLPDMEQCVERILRARDHGERVLVYGDFDVDGVAGTAVLVRALAAAGIEVRGTTADRLTEGYGFHPSGTAEAARLGATLIITVDCGTSSATTVLAAGQEGIETIVTDHHEPGPDELPRACGVINPKREDSQYPFRDLAGAGVALRVADAVMARCRGNTRLTELAALGTVGDVMPLVDENRAIVHDGLEALQQTGSAGLAALRRQAGLPAGRLTAGQLAFGLVPRLNAAGRMGSAMRSLELLLTDDVAAAGRLARELDEENRRRQAVEREMVEAACRKVETAGGLESRRVLVAAEQGWHPGVIGIAASRLADRYRRPVILLVVEGGRARGSGRSKHGLHLTRVLEQCSRLLTRYGGHAQAAGLELPAEGIEAFREAVDEAAGREMSGAVPHPDWTADAEVGLADLDEKAVEGLAAFEPCGCANPSPLFLTRDLALAGPGSVMGRGHLNLKVRHRGTVMRAVGFGLGSRLPEVLRWKQGFDGLYQAKINDWSGRRRVELHLKDIRPASS